MPMARGESVPLLAAQHASRQYAQERGDFLSRVTFSWLGELLQRGAAAPLTLPDLGPLGTADEADHVWRQLQDALEVNGVSGRSPMTPLERTYALWRAIRQAFGVNMYIAGGCKLAGDCLGFVGPVCINALIKYVEDPSSAWFAPRYFGFIISAVLFLSTLLQSLCLHQHHHLVIREAIRVRSALTMTVYAKALRLSTQTKSELGSGHILNLATTDATRILDLFYVVHYAWAAPLQMVIGTMLLVRYLGYAAFAGIAIMIVLIPASAALSSHAAQISKLLLERTDERLKFLAEVLRYIRVIKFYAWERDMLDRIESVREHELGLLARMMIWNASSQVALQAGPILVSLSSFAMYTWIETKPLSADAAFTAISLFSIFRLPLTTLPRVFALAFQANVSVQRLAEFLAAEEHAPSTITVSQTKGGSPPLLGLRRATFEWRIAETDVKMEDPGSLIVSDGIVAADGTSTEVNLHDVSVTIPEGKLTLIIGPVGSGKSTLLAALLHELQPVSGRVVMPNERISYTPQSAYIVNASIQDNITFGSRTDKTRLQQVVSSCELEADLQQLPDGLQTELGENGINLSGGQKQRVSIARAVYPIDQNLYVFDDALSALDTNVASRIFDQCFSGTSESLLAGSTRILATHSLHFASSADWIIVMDKMRVVQMGTFEQLMARVPREGSLSSMLQLYYDHSDEEDLQSGTSEDEEFVLRDELQSAEVSTNGSTHQLENVVLTPTSDAATKNPGALVGQENRAVGNVANSVFLSYFRSCGLVLSVGALAVLVSAQLSQVSRDLWLTEWTSKPLTAASTQLSIYLYIYAYLSFITITLNFAGDVSSRLAGLNASRTIHYRLLRRVIKGTMRFFDTTPIGRILNRFSNDMTTIDQKLSASVTSFATIALSLASMLVIQFATAPLLLLVFLPVFGLYFAIQGFYRRSCCELQRLDSVTKSPIYAHFTETLHGLTTIRVFQRVDQSTSDQAQHIDQNTRAFLTLNLINRWVGVRLETLGALITLSVACFVSIDHGKMSSAMAGLMLSYAQNITGLLNWIVRTNIDMENMMNSVERTDEYCEVDVEAIPDSDSEDDDDDSDDEGNWTTAPGYSIAPFASTTTRLHRREPLFTKSPHLVHRPRWPENGNISFVDVHVKYYPAGDLVLRGVSFNVVGGERVGICGRTGAGKSSLLLALFQMIRCESGHIEIDGLDISLLPLTDLRARMAIIPQDPVLFATSLRFNIDPTGIADDATLWEVIRKAHLSAFVDRLPGQLNGVISEGGENCSRGERQLICLARAILRRANILCLDEATASMDYVTDALIQESIRHDFASTTVLTIAHRVQTIADYDKIIVLADGRVAEFGTPHELLTIEDGYYSAMMENYCC